VVSIPFIIWAFTAGGTPLVGLFTTLLLLALVLAVVCALGLGFSALASRTAGSALLTYVTMAGLTVVSLIVFGLSIPVVSGEETVQVYRDDWADERDFEFDEETGEILDGPPCVLVEEERYITRTDRTWWLLAVNPFVVVADALPPATGRYAGGDPMTAIRYGVRAARLAPQEPLQECWNRYGSMDWEQREAEQRERADALGAVWPWGLAFQLLLGLGAVVLAVRRLQIPQGRLPRGVRIA
jgi:hypothetical protein